MGYLRILEMLGIFLRFLGILRNFRGFWDLEILGKLGIFGICRDFREF